MCVLARQHLGRCHHNGLVARISCRRKRKRGNGRFTRTHISQQQVIHASWFSHICQNLTYRLHLVLRERKRHHLEKLKHSWTIGRVSNGNMLVGVVRAALCTRSLKHERQFKQQHFFVDQAPMRKPHIIHGQRKMNGAQCVAARHQAMLLAQRQRHEVLRAVSLLQSIANQSAHPSGRYVRTSRMNRYDEAISACIRTRVRAFERLDERVCHALEAVVKFDFARNGNMHVLRKRIHEPRLTKRRYHHDARLVYQSNFDKCEFRLGPLQFHLVDATANRAALANCCGANSFDFRQVNVATREQSKQIPNR